jgi:uncharacterized membrane-anchored protein YhcB (DUF1043 family)
METTTTFVLGIVAGGLIITLIGSLVEVLKMRKQIAELRKSNAQSDKELEDIHNSFDRQFEMMDRTVSETHEDIMRDIRETSEMIHRTIDEINRHMETLAQREREQTQQEVSMLFDEIRKHTKEEEHIRFEDFNTLQKRIDETNRYVDSRIDRAIDGLCTRMDTMFIQKETDTTILKS